MQRLRLIQSVLSKMATSNVPTRKLNTGYEMPLLGYGTGTALFKRDNFEEIDRTTVDYVKNAIRLGFHHLDGAELYNTEPELGVAIRESGLPRSSLFITTKVWNTIDDIPHAIDQSLSKLGLDYVDLYLIHSPWFAKSPVDYQKTWKQMEEIQKSGKARSIGVSNYIVEHLEEVLKTAEIVPAVNQVEFHPYLQRENLVPWSEERGIVTSAFGPLSSITKAAPGPTDEVVERLSAKYGVSKEAILLRWCVDQGVVAITTTSKESRLRDYLEVTKFKLSEGEVAEIGAEGQKKHARFNNFGHQWDPNDRR